MLTPRRILAALVLSLLVSAAVLHGPGPAAAQTVDEIIKRGKIIVGVNTTSRSSAWPARTASPKATTRTWRG